MEQPLPNQKEPTVSTETAEAEVNAVLAVAGLAAAHGAG